MLQYSTFDVVCCALKCSLTGHQHTQIRYNKNALKLQSVESKPGVYWWRGGLGGVQFPLLKFYGKLEGGGGLSPLYNYRR